MNSSNTIFKREIDYVNQHNLHSDYNLTLKKIQEAKYKTKDIGVTARSFSSWEESGLLLNKYPEHKQKWFSLSELVWLTIIKHLRSFNVSLNVIKEVKDRIAHLLLIRDIVEMRGSKEAVFEYLDEIGTPEINKKILQVFIDSEEFYELPAPFHSLDAALGYMLFFRSQFSLIVFADGESLLINESMKDVELEEGTVQEYLQYPHISISLTQILAEALSESTGKAILGQYPSITVEEKMILEKCTQKDVKTITIHFNQGKPTHIDVTKNEGLDAGRRIEEIILRGAYQDIRLKTQKGNLVSCINTIKYKL